MSKTAKKPLAKIIDEIEYPEQFIEGFVVTMSYQLDGKKWGRTMSIADEAPDEAIRYCLKRFAEEVIRQRNNYEV